ncbi:MAG: LarC family nickel insertion protein, partial [Polyangiaceae bacterium]|nr:LarC family nickel insertion protein [Polyangiaceae bacterium]
ALDAWSAPLVMKKGRPGQLLAFLCEEDHGQELTELVLKETSSLGVRLQRIERTSLQREAVAVSTPFGEIAVKVGLWKGRAMKGKPEYEDCARAAREYGVPLKTVQEAALHAYRARDKR